MQQNVCIGIGIRCITVMTPDGRQCGVTHGHIAMNFDTLITTSSLPSIHNS